MNPEFDWVDKNRAVNWVVSASYRKINLVAQSSNFDRNGILLWSSNGMLL
jgi:hypothetical protein